MISDQAIVLLEAKLGPVYEKQKQSPEGITRFVETVKVLTSAITEAQTDLGNSRNNLCTELRNIGSLSDADLEQFTNGLDTISTELNTIQKKSNDLARFCGQLTSDFAQITDKLDTETTILSRAILIKSYLSDITIYDSTRNFDSVKRTLKKKSGLSFAEPGDEDLLRQEIHDDNENLYFVKFVNNIKNLKTSTSPNLNLHRTAEYVSKLLKIVAVTQKQGFVATAYANLTTHAGLLSRALHNMFINSEQTDIDELKNITNSLSLLTPIETIINTFVQASPLFSSEQSSALQFVDSLLDEPNARIIGKYETFTVFLSKTCASIWPTVQKIFDRPQLVKLRIIKKICEVLSSFIGPVLEKYKAQNCEEIYCQTFASLYQLSEKMIDSIFRIDNTEITSKQSVLDDLFSTYQSKYSGLEITVYLKRLNAQLDYKKELLDQAMKSPTLLRKSDDVNPFALFSEELFPEIIVLSKQTLVRLSILSKPNTVQPNLKKVTQVFLEDNFGRLMIQFVKATRVHIINNPDIIDNVPKFVQLIMMLNSNILSLEEIYNNTLKAVYRPYAQVHQLFLKWKEQLIVNLENETVSGLETCINCVTNYTKKLLSSKQKKIDFYSNHDVPDPNITEACESFCSFFKKFLSDISSSITGENAISFMTVLGLRLFDCIVDHLTSYKYNLSGGFNLMVDVNEYKMVFDEMKVPVIDEIFSELVAVSRIMTVLPEHISDLFNSLTLSDKAIQFAKKFIQQRSDDKKFNIAEIWAEKFFG